MVICAPKETSSVYSSYWHVVAKSADLLKRHFERPLRGIRDGERHLFFASHGCIWHKKQVSQQSLREILACFATSGPPVHLMGSISEEDLCQVVEGGQPVLSHNSRPFRTCRQ